MIPLPHTGLQIPHDRLNIHTFAELETPNGVAFTAKLTLDGRTAGVIANQGNGGGTYYQPDADSPFGHRAVAEFASACRTETGRVPGEEDLLDLLIEEHTIAQELAAAQMLGKTLGRHIYPLHDDPDHELAGETYVCETRHLYPVTHATQGERDILARLLDIWVPCEGGTWQIWINGAWTPLAVTS